MLTVYRRIDKYPTRAEIFLQIPYRRDRQDDKCPTYAQEKDEHAWNWLSYDILIWYFSW